MMGRYQKKISRKLYGFAQLAGGIGQAEFVLKSSSTGFDYSNESKNNVYLINFAPGILYAIHPRLGAKLSLGDIAYRNERGLGKTKIQTFNVNLNPRNWTFGLFYVVRRRKQK